MKKIGYLLFLLLFPNLYSSAQTDMKKLWKIVNNEGKADTIRLEAMLEICMYGYLYTYPDSASFYADQLYAMAGKMHSRKYQAAAWNVQGASYSLRGDNTRAITYFTRSLKIMESLKDQKGIASCLNNIGVIYNEQGKYRKAGEYYQRALIINKQRGDSSSIALSYSNLGNIYRYRKNYSKAIDYHQKSIAIYQSLRDDYSLGMSFHFIGVTYFDMGDYQKALEFNEKSIPYYEKSENLLGLPEVLNILGKIYDKKGDLQKAIQYNKEALELAKKVDAAAAMRESSLSLYEDYKKLGKFRDALEMHELYIRMRDKVTNEESQQELIRQELSYEFEKQQAIDKKEHEKRLAVQKVILFSVIGGSLLVLVFAVIVINRLRITRKQKAIIERQKDLVEEKQKEILDSITYAKRLQDAILPPIDIFKDHFPESFILYKPKDIVAGDFYWMEKTGNLILVAVADCTGHGVPGALVSVVCSTALNRAVMEFGLTAPGKILDKTREIVLETFAKSPKDVKDGMDISLASINTKTLEIEWAGANNPLWYVSNEELHVITADKQPIGSSFDPQPFKTHQLQLQKGDLVFLFTDGYADQFGGEKGKKFKYTPLKELLLKNAPLPMSSQEARLESTFENWKSGIEQVDDVCIMGIRV
ncbi:tetratricopeptide repeat protein [Fluviicola chungangensis]|uniref:Tetratricopeptide repeat protein n=1 Tax=Fluviicola chungangensis TaxID=2597671 RepID=A0A556MQ66_9FLAO|nr:tetratricopeptide repeat protein [Fluviicola chungangensis]TSJ42083.1 tetratricopeptide repeat protein [Fluviicola chungangensis]